MPWRELVAVPSPLSINTRVRIASTHQMVKYFGAPTKILSDDCDIRAISPVIKPDIVTIKCGRWKMTGFRPFLLLMDQVFHEYEDRFPAAYRDMSHAGVLCVRRIRGSRRTPSKHSWGTAIDLGFGGSVDRRNDDLCYQGLLDFYGIAKKYGLYWGAGFAIEDAMHFEAGEALIQKWGLPYWKEGRR